MSARLSFAKPFLFFSYSAACLLQRVAAWGAQYVSVPTLLSILPPESHAHRLLR